VTAGENFMRLGNPRRIWAVAACHGAIEQLDRVHAKIAPRFAAGDRLVYLGNYLGCPDSADIVDRLLAFRTYMMAGPGVIATDIVYLRGIQEEIWSKLLQLQFAPNPREVLRWMLDRGAAATLAAYGGNPKDGLSATMGGATAIARWTNRLREAVRRRPGHEKFMSVLRRVDGRRGWRPVAVRPCRDRPFPPARRPGRQLLVGRPRLRPTDRAFRKLQAGVPGVRPGGPRRQAGRLCRDAGHRIGLARHADRGRDRARWTNNRHHKGLTLTSGTGWRAYS